MSAHVLIMAAEGSAAESTGSIAVGLLNIFAALALLTGIFFLFVGAVGIWRFPDAYQRLHAASKCTTLGLTGLLLAACIHMPDPVVVSKAIITVAFTFVANPVGSHLIAKAAHHGGVPGWERNLSDELAEDKSNPQMSVSDDFIGAAGLDDAEGPAPPSPATDHQPEPADPPKRGAA